MKYTEFCIAAEKSIRDALRQLDKTAKKILFVVENGRLIATLTDGDVRRHLLRGGKLDDGVADIANRHPKTAFTRTDARNLLRKKDAPLSAIPVVRADGTLLDIVFRDEDSIPTLPQLGLPVVIMAGGKGARLEPYTKILPKPLIPVGELPIIEHIMERFRSYGCEEFHIIVNYKKELIKAYFHESERQYCIHWYDEDKPLDTGGGLSLLKGRLNGTFFLTNCDILLQSDFKAMLRFHREGGNAITMVAANQTMTLPYGVIETGADGIIEMLREKPEMTFLTNTGMYILEPDVLWDIQDNVPIKFTDIMEAQRKKGRRVAAFPVSEDEWLDMGQMEELEEMRKRLYGG